jgi:hypothetical protein
MPITVIDVNNVAKEEPDCPAPHEDYRKPVPKWDGFGNKVGACPGDKIVVAARLAVSGANGMLKIPETPVWQVDLSGLNDDNLSYLQEHCQSDLPCVGHFFVSVVRLERPPLVLKPGEYLDADGMVCSSSGPLRGSCRGAGMWEVVATLDSFKP